MSTQNWNIAKILRQLLGEIEPYGDTAIDNERLNNVQNYYEALSFIIYKLEESAKLINRNESSIKEIAKECKDILEEYGIEVEDE